jgi:hypothetical protein
VNLPHTGQERGTGCHSLPCRHITTFQSSVIFSGSLTLWQEAPAPIQNLCGCMRVVCGHLFLHLLTQAKCHQLNQAIMPSLNRTGQSSLLMTLYPLQNAFPYLYLLLCMRPHEESVMVTPTLKMNMWLGWDMRQQNPTRRFLSTMTATIPLSHPLIPQEDTASCLSQALPHH